MAKGDLVLTRAEQNDLRQLLADLIFPAKANGPVPMQVGYWDDLMAQHRRWMDVLGVTDDEIEAAANERYNRLTYGA